MATQDFTKYIDFVHECAKAALPAIISQDSANRTPDRACNLAFAYARQMMAEAIKFEKELSDKKEHANV